MSRTWKYWSAGVAIVLLIAIACVSVSGAGSGKLAVPGLAGANCFGGTSGDQGYFIQQTTDGGYILTGITNSNDGDVNGNHGGEDVWVVKLSNDMTLQWQKCLGGTGDEQGHSIQQTSDDGFILTGYTNSNDGDVTGNHGGNDVWVVKLNAEGLLLWQKCLGGTLHEYSYSIQQTSDLGYILTGYTDSTDGDVNGNHGGADIWVVKLNVTGGLVWQKCFGGWLSDVGYFIQQTSDGGFILTGGTNSVNGDVTGNHGNGDLWVVKLSEDGMIQWQKCLGGMSSESGSSIQQTSDLGYILMGSTDSTDGDVNGNHGHWDVWVVKLNVAGGLVWQKCLGGTDSEYGYSIQQTTDGGYILSGYTASTNGDVNGNHGGADVWVVKLNAEGLPLWQRCLGGTNEEYGYSIQQTTDGGYILSGYTFSTDGDVSGNHGAVGTSDVWVVKFFGPPMLTGIAPARVTAGTNPSFVITGENLIQSMLTSSTVTLYKRGTPEINLPVTGVSTNMGSITCTPMPGSIVTPGVYSLQWMTPDNQYVVLPDAVTVTCGLPPTVTTITPTSGLQGNFITGAVIKGTRFWTTGGVTAYLNRTGQSNIPVKVFVASTTQMTAEFLIPAGSATGKWNLVVRNPDGQYAMKKDAFTVTLRTFKPPRVSSVTPRTVTSGQTVYINGIVGSFFNNSATVAMTGPRGLSIPVSNVSVLSATMITCDADLTNISKGYATVVVTNPDGKKAIRARAFSIR